MRFLSALALFPLPNGYRPPATFLDNIADVELLVAFGLFALFTLTYGLFFRWWKRPAGRAVLSVFFSITALIFYAMFTRLFTPGDYPGRDIVRVVVYALAPLSGLYLFSVLIRNWIQGGPLIGPIAEVEQRHIPQAASDDGSRSEEPSPAS